MWGGLGDGDPDVADHAGTLDVGECQGLAGGEGGVGRALAAWAEVRRGLGGDFLEAGSVGCTRLHGPPAQRRELAPARSRGRLFKCPDI